MTSHLAHAMRRGLMGPGHIRNLEAALGKRAGALSDAEKGQARANIGADVLAGFRNKVINGDFDIWQRGPSRVTSGSGAGSMAADRWRHSGNFTGTSITWSQNTFSHGQSDVPGNPRHFFRVERTLTAANPASLQHRIENVRTLAGLRATLTFYAKGTGGKQIALSLRQAFGTGGAPTAETIVFQQTVALNATWTKYRYVIDVPSIAGKSVGSDLNDFIAIDWEMAAAQGNMVFDIAHVSLVEGDASAEADPFSPRQIGQELALCQRYFQTLNNNISGGGYKYAAAGASHMEAGGGLLPVRMRSAPTINTDNTSTVYTNCSALLAFASAWDFSLRVTTTAAGIYRAYGAAITLDAEM